MCGGGGGSDMVCQTTCLSISLHGYTYLWEPCPCGHDPSALHCVQGPETIEQFSMEPMSDP